MKEKEVTRTWLSVASLGMALLLLLSSWIHPVKAQEIVIREPQVVTDTSMKAGIKATYDCVWFGHYPQSEVTAADGAIYTKLKNAGGWDINGDVAIDGVKYRRIRKNDASATGTSETCYQWEDALTYHYFRYEPMKWRVLGTNGNYLLLADQVIDSRKGDESSDPSFGWDMCSLRSWLNGYDAGMNKYGKDYTKTNFIDSAFSAEEKAAVITGSVKGNGFNYQNGSVTGVRNYITQDQVFCLSEEEVFKEEQSIVYGFHTSKENEPDEGRACKRTAYAHAMGANHPNWYLRTAGWWGSATDARARTMWYVKSDGTGTHQGPWYGYVGVRPALYLDATALAQYHYAGTVCSDGTVKEQDIPMATEQPSAGNSGGNNNGNNNSGDNNNGGNNNGGNHNGNNNNGDNNNGDSQPGTPSAPGNTNGQKRPPSFAYTKTYKKTIGDKPFALQARLKTGDGSLSYKSSDPKVASVSSTGKVRLKGPGACTVTISTKETANYTGRSVTATILVNPKKPALKALHSGKRQLKAIWKKDAKADGYQIQYSTSKKFTKKTTEVISVNKGKSTSQTIKKLKKGKKYYVRMRSYKKARVSGKSKTLYSPWSKTDVSKMIK